MKDAAGSEVPVIYVLKKNAKAIKNALEENASIDKRSRMTAADAQAEINSDASYKDCIAIPVLQAYFESTNNLGECGGLVVGNGRQQCPFSTSVLGSLQKRHAVQSDNQPENWSSLKQALFQTVQVCFQDRRDRFATWKVQLQKLSHTFCPSKLEFLGDDKNLVLRPAALLAADLECWMQEQEMIRVQDTDEIQQQCNAFMLELWKQVAEIYSCPRILRKGGVDPDSRIRQTGYQLLWPITPSESSIGPGSPGWITVTEQGIRQSFDVTSVMFSRGNISEKIRFGECLVQQGDVVLDLYAGIGYYTLPAILHGKAAYVYACEWNPKALEALRYNLQDNRVDDKATVLAGDCRDLVLPSIKTTTTTGPINRISLGLLPSSEGSWRIAVQALVGTLPTESSEGEEQLPLSEPNGGWLHIHGNVPVKERDIWSHWLCRSLYQHVLVEINQRKDTLGKSASDWIVICHNVEKVKSFAPTVNHYVADIFVGPRKRSRMCLHPQLQKQHSNSYLQIDDDGTCYVYDNTDNKLLAIPNTLSPPSCALSPDGVLHQEWMMSRNS